MGKKLAVQHLHTGKMRWGISVIPVLGREVDGLILGDSLKMANPKLSERPYLYKMENDGGIRSPALQTPCQNLVS